MRAIRWLGRPYCTFLVSVFNQIFKGAEIPESWRKGRVSLLPKEGSDNDIFSNRRPITITPISYRIFMHIIKSRVQEILEINSSIGEWQAGFRRGYRLDDHLFVLSQVIEISRSCGIGLMGVFLDLKKAYDMVDRDILYRVLLEGGFERSLVELVKDIYNNCSIVIERKEGRRSM